MSRTQWGCVVAGFVACWPKLKAGRWTSTDKVRIGGLEITTVATANQYLRSNLPGGGRQNPACTGVQRKDESAYADPDNGESAGFVLTYGRFRTIDLGDLTWNGELDLMCPINRIGTVDLYLTSHHPGAARQGGGGGRAGGAGAAAHSPAYLIKVSARQDGSFTVINTRNGFSKTYAPRP